MNTNRPKVLILHAYSADNAGDGLLVEETLALVREGVGDADITMLASRPDSFSRLGLTVLPTVPTKRGWDPATRDVLNRIDEFDLVIGVGGGYLRAGTPIETLKSSLVMGPQLLAASRTKSPTIYLPQSIGPARFGTRGVVRRMLRGIDTVMVRDDRSLSEVGGPTVVRMPDLATAAIGKGRRPGEPVSPVPVLSIRAVHGRINPAIYRLADQLAPYDAYTQSTVGGNDDRPAMATLEPRGRLERAELMSANGQKRVIVAVRLHAALMALAAGHYVVHLAYERKGFGAFDDLGIRPWVHSVNTFDVERVTAQARALLEDPVVRADYEGRIAQSMDEMVKSRRDIVTRIRGAVGGRS